PPPSARVGNPKRLARQAAREAGQPRPSTAAQEAIRQDIEQRARVAAGHGRQDRDAENAYRRQVRRAKAKARHRGH
ncbi:MAG: DUF2992 family protein, partial [Dactylosporangium sp.]|nr:DUF2992 family protein [Dactylosporangium sp.]NNJ59517.1 DUF2992 family protein [Dactylosporangium sp.]